jgi:hypothetical protein
MGHTGHVTDWRDHELVDVLGDSRWLLYPEAMELRPAWGEVRELDFRWELRRLDSPAAVLDAVTSVLGHPSRTPIGEDDDQLVAGLLRCLHLILDLDWIELHTPVPAEFIEGRVRRFVHDHPSER